MWKAIIPFMVGCFTFIYYTLSTFPKTEEPVQTEQVQVKPVDIMGTVEQVYELSPESRCISVKSTVTESLGKMERICYVARSSQQGMFVKEGNTVEINIIKDRGGIVKIAEVYILD